MTTTAIGQEVIFPQGFDARWEAEMTDKGHLEDVIVRFQDGLRFRVSFIDPVRLKQDLQNEAESGSPYFSEPGLIVVPRLTKESIRSAVEGLAGEGFFENLRPIDGPLESGDEKVPHPFDLIKAGWNLFASARSLPPDEATSTRAEAARLWEHSLGISRAFEKSAEVFLGRCYEEQGNRKQALVAFNKALEIEPDDPTALVQRGLLLHASGDPDAMDDFSLAVRLDTESVWPYYYLARECFMKGDVEEGTHLCERALTLANRPDVKKDLRDWIEIALSARPVESSSLPFIRPEIAFADPRFDQQAA